MKRPINATNYMILAMREKWLNLILDGKKTAEVRRTRPARPCDMPDYLYLYHRGCVHGIAEVRAYRYLPCGWFSLDRGECQEACLSVEEARGYLQLSSLFVPHFAALLAATACLHESSLVASMIASIGLAVTCSLFRAWGYVEGKEDRQ